MDTISYVFLIVVHDGNTSSGTSSNFDQGLYYKVRKFLQDQQTLKNDVDEVFDSIFVGNLTFATDLKAVSSLGITHILNLAPKDEPTGQEFYNEIGIKYYEIDTDDDPDFDLKIHFNSTSEIIDQAMQDNGKILVHCHSGYRRSPAIVIAYMMIIHKMHLWDAVVQVRSKRKIFPNTGFLEQLCMLERELYG